MKVVTSSEMREIDRLAIETHGVRGEDLMEHAGAAVAEAITELIQQKVSGVPQVRFLAGRGNNGGDAFVAARLLQAKRIAVDVVLTGSAAELKGDARIHFDRMQKLGVPTFEVHTPNQWNTLDTQAGAPNVFVDGLLGTGTSGPAREPLASGIAYLNRVADHAVVIAIDLPSGLDPDTGVAHEPTVRADLTATLGLPKRGLLETRALAYVGRLCVYPLPFPSAAMDAIAGTADCTVIDPRDWPNRLQRRARDTHKGTFGHALIIGGSLDYVGAMDLAGRAALRGGCGLVTLRVPEPIGLRVGGGTPELIVRTAEATDTGSLASRLEATWRSSIDQYDVVAIGPGMTRHEETRHLVEQMVSECPRPLILDADAITVLEGQSKRLTQARSPIILTPHPGEFAALTNQSVADVQSNRIEQAQRFATETGTTIILKGAHTVVASPDAKAAVNITGNPGMAAGGSGDVLTGLLASLMAQGLAPGPAAHQAVWLHGTAGDLAATQVTEPGLIASDIIQHIPGAWRKAMAL